MSGLATWDNLPPNAAQHANSPKQRKSDVSVNCPPASLGSLGSSFQASKQMKQCCINHQEWSCMVPPASTISSPSSTCPTRSGLDLPDERVRRLDSLSPFPASSQLASRRVPERGTKRDYSRPASVVDLPLLGSANPRLLHGRFKDTSRHTGPAARDDRP